MLRKVACRCIHIIFSKRQLRMVEMTAIKRCNGKYIDNEMIFKRLKCN
jgi:hypothetical protein